MINPRNLKNKVAKKIDRFFFSRIVRRLSVKFCYLFKITKLPYCPEYLQLDVCGFCNLKCQMCPQGQEGAIKEKGMMDFALYKKIIDKAGAAGVFSVILVVTGEPLINTSFFDMIKYAKSKGLKVQSSTNATLLDAGNARRIIDSGLDEIIFSLDTLNKELYENDRRGASFEAVFANIIRFLELRKNMKSTKPMVVMQNLQRYQANGPKNPRIEKKFLSTFEKYDNIWIMPKYFSNWSGIMSNQSNFSYIENAKSATGTYKVCETIYHRLVSSWDGKAISCCNDFIRGQIIGDLNSQSIMEVWNSPRFIDLRGKLVRKKYNELPLCKSCGVLWPDIKEVG